MLKSNPKVHLHLFGLNVSVYAPKLTCFTVFEILNRSSLVGNCFQNNDTSNRPLQQCMVILYSKS
jgi:hypothetical protein